MLHFLRLFYRSSKYQQHWTLLNTFQFPTAKPSNRKNVNFNSFLIFNFLIKSRNAENFGNVPPPNFHKELFLFSNIELSDLKLGRLNWKMWKFECADSTFLSIESHSAETVGKAQFLIKPTKISIYLQYETLWKEFLIFVFWNDSEFLVSFAHTNFYIWSLTVPEMLHFLRLFFKSSRHQQYWTLLNTIKFPTVTPSNRKTFIFKSLLIFIFLIKSHSGEDFTTVTLGLISRDWTV